MGSTWGNRIKISLFGESHGPAIGVVLDGLPAGYAIDLSSIQKEMARRAAVGKILTTSRKEPDQVEILSGVYEGKITGTPLMGLIHNTNVRSQDYEKFKNIPRPGHGDLGNYFRYHGFADPRGGGHGSGRLTAPLVLAGAVCKQILTQKYPDIIFESDLIQIGNETDPEKFSEIIEKVRDDGDSVGGLIRGRILNLPPGLGDPIFENVESLLASLLFAIPGVKGVSFGDGFEMAMAKGSEMNDPIFCDDAGISTLTNHNGGINGGITNGMPVVFTVAFKPTPSIAKTQQTIDLETKESVELNIIGRHDPCIALRACPIVEACGAIAILELSE